MFLYNKIKANQSNLQQLIEEQSKLNEFICAENILARYKVDLILNYLNQIILKYKILF